MNTELLEALLSQVNVSGNEEPGQKVLEEHMRPYSDKIIKDEIGDVICVLNPESPTRIMLSAHADEIGLIVTNITKEGRLQVIERGGIMQQNYLGQKVKIRTKNGIIYGAVECSRDMFKNEDLKAADFIIDIGATSKEEAKKYVELGDPVVLDTEFRPLLNNRLTARALDDRIGLFVIMEAFKLAKKRGCKLGVYAAATVGEETITSGAYWSSKRIDPELAVVVDVTNCSDYSRFKNPGAFGDIVMGGGPVLTNSMLAPKKLNNQLVECAKRIGVPVQREGARGRSFTDGDKIFFSNQGVPCVFTGVPLRNMHNPGEVVDLKDVQNGIELIAEFLCTYQPKTL